MARQQQTIRSTFTSLIRFLFTLYLLSAILFTAFHFVVRPALSLVAASASRSSDSLGGVPAALVETKMHLEAAIARASRIKEESGALLWGNVKKKDPKQAPVELSSRLQDAPRSSSVGPDGVEWGRELIDWHPVSSSLAHLEPMRGKALRVLHHGPTPMEEDFFLSKAFGESLQPSKVIPYFYRATSDFEKEDITITTLVTSNRFKVLAGLVERYRGGYGPRV
jgi:hypothetical protein